MKMSAYLDIDTIKAAVWRAAVATLDWRTHLRRFLNRSVVDAVFVTNMRDEIDRNRFLGKWRPKCGHFNGPRYKVDGVLGRTRALDIVTEDLATHEGRKKARAYFISAVEWAERKGARVILLAASTKRLFGENGDELKAMFPNLIFTIGDNGTFYLLFSETVRAFEKAGLMPGNCRIGILGAYGLLGELVTELFAKKGYDLVGAGPNTDALKKISEKYNIPVCKNFEEMGKVDAVIACTHSDRILLTAENIELIRKADKKLLVIDVAEPSNLKYREYQKCKDCVIRQDAGNAYSQRLKYVLGAIAYKLFRLTRGVTFGCFAETLSIAFALKKGLKLHHINFFTVNQPNMEIVSKMLQKNSFTTPSPRCFGQEVVSFELSLLYSAETEKELVLSRAK